ncbi:MULTISPECIES: anti-sigma regulatory factor [Leisingera]|jgi:serine/threonine-protein kinase RsbT|uniref:anti-sigma regulatory factor n=1 Tax=Leisingera TaxID=191028 RepID=UPI0011547423|nr:MULTISPECIES: anti-sigma regulatory factor [Leisingera]QDI76613.1 anti-sigma regulatory factor [Leisingera aquaemixtae]
MKAPAADPAVMLQRVSCDSDVVAARQLARRLAEELEFSRPDQALIATAVSELARNIVNYAKEGEIEICTARAGAKTGIKVTARDRGPGLANVELALQDGYSTGNSLGLGLPGTRRIVDEFDICSDPGQGLVVTVIKWR